MRAGVLKALACVQVWRILFWAMAGLAILTCVVTGLMGVEPRRYLPKKDKVTYLPGMPEQSTGTEYQDRHCCLMLPRIPGSMHERRWPGPVFHLMLRVI